jgi:hypothetical protein
MLATYGAKYRSLKAPRNLQWKPSLGTVSLELAIGDQTLDFNVSFQLWLPRGLIVALHSSWHAGFATPDCRLKQLACSRCDANACLLVIKLFLHWSARRSLPSMPQC